MIRGDYSKASLSSRGLRLVGTYMPLTTKFKVNFSQVIHIWVCLLLYLGKI